MAGDVPVLKQGEVDAEHFELLLGDTKTSGERVIAALRDHLVGGLGTKESIEKHGVAPSQFYKRLKGIQDKNAFVQSIKKFYI